MGEIRDFRAATIETMWENVDEDPQSFWGGAGGWIDGFKNRALEKDDIPDLYDAMGNVGSYFEYVLEKNDIHAGALKTILEAVWSRESETNTRAFSHTDERLKNYNSLVEDLSKSIYSGSFIVDFNMLDSYEELFLNGAWGDVTLSDEAMKRLEELEIARRVATDMTDERINQYTAYPTDDEYPASFGPTACYATCILMVAHILGFPDLTMWDLINEGIVAKSNGWVHKDPTDYFTIEQKTCASEADYCAAIYEALANGWPVIVQLQGHFVLAISADGKTSFWDIWVVDPADGTRKTLAEAVTAFGLYRPVIGIRICKPLQE